ncbi:MAG TPA: OmpA family protein, partial [Paucimonas sp.]|nr:OmpA family protein [Paucimonas sp.]
MLKKIAAVLIACAASSALAQTDIKAKTPNSAYLQDGRGVITRSGTGLCWRAGYWTPADAVPGCDGELAPPVQKPTAPPVAVTPPPPPPPPPAPPKRCDFSVTLANDETFTFNKAELTDAARKRIDDTV